MRGWKMCVPGRYLAVLAGLVLAVGNPAADPFSASREGSAAWTAAADARPVLASPKSGPRHPAPRVEHDTYDPVPVPVPPAHCAPNAAAFVLHNRNSTTPARIVRTHHGPRPPPGVRRS